MHYQYVRFNIYPGERAPEEKEQWLSLDEHHDDAGLKTLLARQHGCQVSIIKSAVISQEQYDNQTPVW